MCNSADLENKKNVDILNIKKKRDREICLLECVAAVAAAASKRVTDYTFRSLFRNPPSSFIYLFCFILLKQRGAERIGQDRTQNKYLALLLFGYCVGTTRKQKKKKKLTTNDCE